ncbi:complement C2 [Python bivittatus]|uniref:Complement C2 n=1 Tax=Python bivittatus TaxID=176946 RepID=A0A9F5MVU2_PYTBI|nr:complement C2 [Python bivittatus]
MVDCKRFPSLKDIVPVMKPPRCDTIPRNRDGKTQVFTKVGTIGAAFPALTPNLSKLDLREIKAGRREARPSGKPPHAVVCKRHSQQFTNQPTNQPTNRVKAAAPGAVATQDSVLDATSSCPRASIQGGKISLSDGYRPGSILTFSCPAGTYPYPTPSRVCQPDAKWTPMHHPSGTLTNIARCRDIRCPAQTSFENGFFSPRRNSHPIGDILSFECSDGYQLLGSSQRYCQPNGQWNGTSPVCDDGVGHCRALAIPPGAIATGRGNRLGDQVSFQCQTGLDLIGSSQRVCMLDSEWSGTQPSCRAHYSYDRAEDVKAEFGASLTGVLSEVSAFEFDPSGTSQPSSLGRRLILTKESFLYVYFLVDASHSVTERNFAIFKNAVSQIITRVSFCRYDLDKEVGGGGASNSADYS